MRKLYITLGLTIPFQLFAVSNSEVSSPFYIGGVVGYGSTTWSGLVPATVNQNLAISISTPKLVEEGGPAWGVVVGYELIPYFAIEAGYRRFSDATITFDENSLFAFDHDQRTSFTSRTDTTNLMAKLMMLIPHTNVKAYSSAGVAGVHRSDIIINRWSVAPTFGLGVTHNISKHFMIDFGVNYTAGYGESEINPAEDYVPFLYSFAVTLAYRY